MIKTKEEAQEVINKIKTKKNLTSSDKLALVILTKLIAEGIK